MESSSVEEIFNHSQESGRELISDGCVHEGYAFSENSVDHEISYK